MNRNAYWLPLFALVFVLGCGSSPTVIEPDDEPDVTMAEEEMETDEYAEAMNNL